MLEGTAGEQDVDQAISLYQGIVDNDGHDIVLCALKLGNIYNEGVYVDKDTEKAAQYYQIVLDHADADSDEAAEAQAALDAING